ncbi:hypothetical protein KUTeg_016899 [Tegillarca granosa]|uniref:GDP-fucose protein O-fucosyltransferase 1 n=1 Tax=Tegillarca granosa TaxID=220873 RepID=A0ABQ9EMB3_TEGGR|nr:hypothetical protein KUTeg_016899 [Tegillarca granosa]
MNCAVDVAVLKNEEKHGHLNVPEASSHHRLSEEPSNFHWDDRGYVIFCLCMGRFGNQAEHFLGGLAFAKKIDRTLILPPFRTYSFPLQKNVPFDEWFKVDAIKEYHRVILADDFMKHLAPAHWPPGNRTGFCYGAPGNDCKMKEDKFPVLALKGAPAPFPMEEQNVPLQKYLQWSDNIEKEVNKYIQELFNGEKFIGLHLRNGVDWENACRNLDDFTNYMASPQCLGYKGDKKVTTKICLPPKEEVLRLTKNIVLSTKIKNIYVATDKDPMIKDLTKHLEKQKIKVVHLDPWLPQIDLAILGKSEHFIGNCVSSFTSFVTRERLVTGKPTSFWGYS